MPASCIKAAQTLWTSKTAPLPMLPAPTDSEISEGTARLSATGEMNVKLYDSLLESLCSAVLNENL